MDAVGISAVNMLLRTPVLVTRRRIAPQSYRPDRRVSSKPHRLN